YHGHADSFLVKAGSGVATLGLPDSPGVPPGLAELTATVPFNDAAAVEDVFGRRGPELAAVIVEPYMGNAGFIAPEQNFHATLRSLCDRHGALLIFDEVMTGFRVAAGGAQERLGIRPDLTTLGKIIGGGMPVGAFGYGVVRALAPGRAGARRVPRPLGLRGRLRLRCAHRCRYRLHHRTTRRGAGRGAGSLASSPRSGPPVPGRSRSPPAPSRSC